MFCRRAPKRNQSVSTETKTIQIQKLTKIQRKLIPYDTYITTQVFLTWVQSVRQLINAKGLVFENYIGSNFHECL